MIRKICIFYRRVDQPPSRDRISLGVANDSHRGDQRLKFRGFRKCLQDRGKIGIPAETADLDLGSKINMT